MLRSSSSNASLLSGLEKLTTLRLFSKSIHRCCKTCKIFYQISSLVKAFFLFTRFFFVRLQFPFWSISVAEDALRFCQFFLRKWELYPPTWESQEVATVVLFALSSNKKELVQMPVFHYVMHFFSQHYVYTFEFQ